MKIIEHTYPDGSHSYSTGGSILLVDKVAPVSSEVYECDDELGMSFMKNPALYTFEKGEIKDAIIP